MITKTIFEAKTNLSELVRKAQKGEEVIITSGRNRVPVARLEAIHPAGKKAPRCNGNPGFMLTDAFWQPLPEEELRPWNGEGE